ncbi:hypothetical protein [Candidatus Uabimicrobium amorphum]|uniref:Uncharacterized protein n=1 Tax=Uabimicrobium amorphum TaxID=2596890 RepID=A0A5S9F1I9_UABAM|nr:hypothetical protein [Candidatus Uabimicrobium amorphum]BBM82113.1 hypothetical protein UABAM_00456 [Candidatus Uabimicrobium amorphum]
MKRKDNMPTMVYIALLGIRSRKQAWGFVWLAILISIVCFAYSFINKDALFFTIVIFAAYWYFTAIKWMDQHSSWES